MIVKFRLNFENVSLFLRASVASFKARCIRFTRNCAVSLTCCFIFTFVELPKSEKEEEVTPEPEVRIVVCVKQ